MRAKDLGVVFTTLHSPHNLQNCPKSLNTQTIDRLTKENTLAYWVSYEGNEM
jgi:hypothetical protein